MLTSFSISLIQGRVILLEGPLIENSLTKSTCWKGRGIFSWLMSNVGGPRSLWAVVTLELVVWVLQEAGWESPEEQAGEPHFSLVSTLVQASRLLPWLSSVMDCNADQYAEINPLFPKLLLVVVFYDSNRKVTKTLLPSPQETGKTALTKTQKTRWGRTNKSLVPWILLPCPQEIPSRGS